MTPDSVRRGDVSRLVGVTKPFPRWGWRFWHRNSAILVRYRDVIPCDDREILLRESESRENPTRGPGRSGCVAIIPTRMKVFFRRVAVARASRRCVVVARVLCLVLVLAAFVSCFCLAKVWAGRLYLARIHI